MASTLDFVNSIKWFDMSQSTSHKIRSIMLRKIMITAIFRRVYGHFYGRVYWRFYWRFYGRLYERFYWRFTDVYMGVFMVVFMCVFMSGFMGIFMSVFTDVFMGVFEHILNTFDLESKVWWWETQKKIVIFQTFHLSPLFVS